MPNITLNEPTLTFDINQYFREFLSFLATGNVYGQSPISIPATRPAIGAALLSVVAQDTAGAVLASGTYFYVIEAVLQTPDVSGLVTKETLISREIEVQISGSNNSTLLSWSWYPSQYVVSYNIYRTNESGNYRNCLIANAAIPATSFVDDGYVAQLGSPLAQQVVLTGSSSVPGTYVYGLFNSNKNGVASLFQTITTSPDGAFTFNVSVPYGSNSFYVQEVASNVPINNPSNSIYINANNLFAFFDMMANDLFTYWQELIERINAGPHLFEVNDLFQPTLPDSILPWSNATTYQINDFVTYFGVTYYSIQNGNINNTPGFTPDSWQVYPVSRLSQLSDFASFWQVLTKVIRPSAYTDAQYRNLVVVAVTAYREATSYAAIKNLILAILPGWLDTSFIPLDVYNTGFQLGQGSNPNVLGKFRVVRSAPYATSLTYNWNGGVGLVPYVVGNVRGYIPGNQATIIPPVGVNIFYTIVYLDGTKDANGYFNVKTTNIPWVTPTYNRSDAFVQQVLPTGVVVLAIIHCFGGDIRWISGQGYLGSRGMNQWTATTPSGNTGYQNPSLVNVNGVLFETGGYDTTNSVYTNEIHSSQDSYQWISEPTPAWPARASHASLSFNNVLWVMQGVNSGGYLNDVWTVSNLGVWTETNSAAMSTGRQSPMAVVYNNKMFLMGGTDHTGAPQQDVYESLDGYTWTSLGNAPWQGREGAGLVVFNGLMFLIGGYGSSGQYLNDIWSSPDGVSWTLVLNAAPWIARSNFGCVVLNGLIYVFSGENVTPSDLWYSPDGFNWIQGANTEPDMSPYSFATTTFGNSIVVVGGQPGTEQTIWQWKYTGHGPYLVGPSCITDRARLNSRGYKYSRMAIYLSTLCPTNVDYNTFVVMLSNLLEQVKPAKMTILLGYPPNDTYTELYNGED